MNAMAQLTLQHDLPPIVERKLAASSAGNPHVRLARRTGRAGDHAGRCLLGRAARRLVVRAAAGVRLAALIVVGAIGLWVAYRYLLRRVFVRLSDASLAVLLERRFSQLKDHLLTAVDMAAGDGDIDHRIIRNWWRARARLPPPPRSTSTPANCFDAVR